jgi:hypothetical protein
MNLDLLKKLTRLANNNPNDNEANLAARKVCQMLEKSNWSLGPVNARDTPLGKTWNDVRRSTEPQWSGKPPQDPGQPFNFDEFYKSAAYNYRPTRKQEEFFGGRRGGKTAQEEIRKRECIKCRETKETTYIGNLYVCNECIWKEWNKMRNL